MPSPTARSRACLLVLCLVCALLVGCQAITTLPAPSTAAEASVAASSAASPAAAPSLAASTSAAPASSAEPSPAVATATAEPGALQPAPLATLDSLAAVELPTRDPIDQAFRFGRTTDRREIVRTTPFDVQVGSKETFSVSDIGADPGGQDRNYTISATLVLALDHVLVYVQDGIDVDLADLERSSREFNDQIYDRNRELFGSEWTPGIDGDPRLTILNASIDGAGGYFSASDEVPRSVNRFSNEREMFYINVDSYAPGDEAYASVLAHEFQHMIAWNEAPRNSTWTNEGLSQLAEELNGYGDSPVSTSIAYLANPDLQLTDWGDSPNESLAHYGGSYLFISYFYEHYGQPADLKRLIGEVAGENLEVFAAIAATTNAAIRSFDDLYADWATANILDDESIADGRYAYRQLVETVEPETLSGAADETVAQYGADYWTLPRSSGERVLRFDGSDTIGVVGARPEGQALWWSNRGDNVDTSLEREFDLRDVDSATLQLRAWYQIEDGWDYGYVAVSTDNGERWTTLPGRYTTTEDPQGANFGNGWTGISGEPGATEPAWVDEQIDLTPYAGQVIRLRFEMVTDQGTNRPGLALDNIRIPEIGFSDDAESEQTSWTARGFIRTDSSLPQRWKVRLVRTSGRQSTVEELALDAQNMGEVRLAPNETGTVVVMATTPHTTERATYRLSTAQP